MVSAPTNERVALVTGAARGLGASLARALGARGYAVAVNARPGGTDPASTVRTILGDGGNAKAFTADVFDTTSSQRLVADIHETFGRLDAIVLAATPPTVTRAFADTTDAVVRSYLDAYIAGPFALVRAAVPDMTGRHFGRIVAILTSALTEIPPRRSAYIAAKAGMLGLCRALAVELATSGITVNALSPGVIGTVNADPAAQAKETIAARTYPMRRLATHDDVAEAVAFLLSEAASYVSGANVPLTGGLPL